MIGNDVIDLQYVGEVPANRLNRMREKVLHKSEQVLLDAFFNNELSYWVAWAAKESVYKLEFQKDPIRYFRPKSIKCCKIHPEEAGFQLEVQGKTGNYPVSINLLGNRIEALAISKEQSFSQVSSFLYQQADTLWGSVLTRQKVNQIIVKHFPEKGFSFQRSPYPVLINEKQITPMSISHHGAWLSIQLLIQEDSIANQ